MDIYNFLFNKYIKWRLNLMFGIIEKNSNNHILCPNFTFTADKMLRCCNCVINKDLIYMDTDSKYTLN